MSPVWDAMNPVWDAMSTARSLRRESYLRASILLLLLLPGCGLSFLSPDRCQDSSDCEPGSVCDLRTGHCALGVHDVFDFELTPPLLSPGAPTQLAALAITDPAATDLVLDVPVAFSGQVTAPLGVPGSIGLSRRPAFGDRSLLWSFLVGDDGTFQTSIGYAPGRATYDAVFYPSHRGEFPELRYTDLVVPDAGGLEVHLAYPAYPVPDQADAQTDLLLVRLRVLESEARPFPVPNLAVSARSDLGLLTNAAVPDAQGYVFLRLPVVYQGSTPGFARELSLVFAPSSLGVRLPTVELDPIPLVGPFLGTFYFGEVPPSRGVQGLVTAGSVPVAGCQIHFRSLAVGRGHFELVVATDDSGRFSTTLPEGTYQVMAVPELQSDVALQWREDVQVGLGMAPIELDLPERLQIGGTLLDRQGQGVAGALVRADRLGSVLGRDDTVRRRFETTTASDGRFALTIDPGNYDLLFRAEGLPIEVIEGVPLYADTALGVTTLAEPRLVQGHVFSGAGSPLCGVTIEAFRTENGVSTRLGAALSAGGLQGCSGTYHLVLPAD